jgi:hypothetical protein
MPLPLATVAVFLLGLLTAAAPRAATVWTGPSIAFARVDGADFDQPANQDRLTPHVWLTRDSTHGIFNVAVETFYSSNSPADTEWSYGTTADLPNLTFAPWVQWHGKCPPCSLGLDAVVHLISDDIYLDIRFTSWTPQFGGGFAYVRSTPASPPTPVTVIEFYNASLDHYFITWVADEISDLDTGVHPGWARTGQSFLAYATVQDGTSPVCRYYIPPALGDSHFFGRDAVECDTTAQKNPSFILEDPQFMQMYVPVAGICPAATTPVYRVFDNRPDANHRYLTDRTLRDQMVASGWLAEGDGPDLVVMCAPQ